MTQALINFTKMHGLGNDFVVIDATRQPIHFQPAFIANLGDRHTGIGFDQLLVIEKSHSADFFCRIYNTDGSEAEQCGNGLRCVARYVHESGLHADSSMTIETKAGIFPIVIQDYDHIRVTMGAPLIEEKLMGFELNHQARQLQMSVLSVGNPHAVIKVDALSPELTDVLGPEISTHTYFPHGANVGFMQIDSPSHIHLRTYERGVGETLACGSNACAAAVSGIINNWLQPRVTVEFRYGSLLIEWEGEGKPINMTGPASRIFSGEVQII